MEVIIASLISSVISGVVVGVVVNVFKSKMDVNAELAKEYSDLKFKSLTDKIFSLDTKVGLLDKKTEIVKVEVNRLSTKLEVMNTEQRFTNENLVGLRKDVEEITLTVKKDYGKVIRK